MKPLLIVKTGSTFTDMARELGDFEHWIERGLGPIQAPIRVMDARTGAPLPSPDELSGAVLTGSHAMVTHREAWSESLAQWLAKMVRRGQPVLGICYGHQLLAHALGGAVHLHPAGMEIGTVDIHATPAATHDPLFRQLPAQFPAQMVHSQSVQALPPGAVLLARNGHEPHAAFRIGDCAWGVQFHPEFSATAMRGYIQALAPELRAGGREPEPLLGKVQETMAAARLLRAFGALIEKR